MPLRTLAGTTTDLFKDGSGSKDGQHGSVAAPMTFKIPYGRTGVRQGRSAGGFHGMLPSPSNPLRAPSNRIAQVHFELHNGTGARQQPGVMRRAVFRPGGRLEPADVRQEATRHDRTLKQVPAGFTRREMASDQDIAGHHNMSAGMGGISGEGPAKTRGPGAGVKTRAFRDWKAT